MVGTQVRLKQQEKQFLYVPQDDQEKECRCRDEKPVGDKPDDNQRNEDLDDNKLYWCGEQCPHQGVKLGETEGYGNNRQHKVELVQKDVRSL